MGPYRVLGGSSNNRSHQPQRRNGGVRAQVKIRCCDGAGYTLARGFLRPWPASVQRVSGRITVSKSCPTWQMMSTLLMDSAGQPTIFSQSSK